MKTREIQKRKWEKGLETATSIIGTISLIFLIYLKGLQAQHKVTDATILVVVVLLIPTAVYYFLFKKNYRISYQTAQLILILSWVLLLIVITQPLLK